MYLYVYIYSYIFNEKIYIYILSYIFNFKYYYIKKLKYITTKIFKIININSKIKIKIYFWYYRIQ